MKPNPKMRAWIEAGRRHHLSHVQVQMARELGVNPKKLGKRDNQDQEPWKMCGSPLSRLPRESSTWRAAASQDILKWRRLQLRRPRIR
jgi:hypothetical protein